MGNRSEFFFDILKAALASPPILIFLDYIKTFYLYTDASNIALGVILAQLDKEGIDRPVSYYSRVFTKPKQNYSISKKE